MRAALISETPGLLDIEDVAVDRPNTREVLVRTVGSGLCHSDLHLIDRRHSLVHAFHGMTESGGYALPGHEASGIVEAVGSDVTHVRPGDHVVTFPRAFCGQCEYCLRGRPAVCADSPGRRRPEEPPRLSFKDKRVYQMANLGAFAEQLLVHENALVKIDPEYPLDRAAILGCSVTTGLGAVLNTAQVRPGSTVAVLGLGGVGLSAIQGAVIAGARQIIGVDTEPARFPPARQLGATDVVDASTIDSVEGVKELSNGGVDFSIEAIGITPTIAQSVQMLRAGGVATIVGVGRGQRLDIEAGLFMEERQVRGCSMGSSRFRLDIPYFIDLDRSGRLDVESLIESHLHLDDINEHYDAMRRKEINGRRVIMFPV